MLLLAGCGEQAARESVGIAVGDPNGAKFQNVTHNDGNVCGEVNGRDARGNYPGYTRFVHNEAADRSSVEPRLRYPDVDLGRAEAACRDPNYLSSGLRALDCQRAAAVREDVERQRAFAALWRRSCGEAAS